MSNLDNIYNQVDMTGISSQGGKSFAPLKHIEKASSSTFTGLAEFNKSLVKLSTELGFEVGYQGRAFQSYT